MKNTLELKLYGYTVKGIDRRDDTDFEDRIIISNLNVRNLSRHIDYIKTSCYNLGLRVNDKGIIPDKKPGYNPDEGITIDLDLQQLYLDQLKTLEERQSGIVQSDGSAIIDLR